ncbi:STAS domain-containing protein [Streptomyces sp. NPDC051921]|uniref:STAS domain-containing protein n=1 Tax=Streptomyces sp. NPDC051921 TaxID=3155806 RepID=UPI00342D3CE0
MMTADRTAYGRVRHTPLADGRHLYSAPGGTSVHRQPTRPDGTAMLRASGEFDLESVGCLRQALTDARNAGGTRVLLDLSGIAFGDSSFLHTLVTARNGPGRLVLVGPLPDHLRRLFDLTGTTRLFDFAENGTT